MNKARTSVLLAFFSLSAALTALNCGGGDGSKAVGQGGQLGGDGDGFGGLGTGASSSTGGSDGGSSVCKDLDEVCSSNAECCGDVRCADSGDGSKRCVDESICGATGASCSQASECCSLSCVGGSCDDSGGLCIPSSGSCTDNSECCSNLCTNGACEAIGQGCSSLGETCSAEGFDSSCCSKNCENLGTQEAPDLRCSRSSSCGARGEICSEASDCCSGVCLDGRCPTQDAIQGQLFAGEPCSKDSECASFACASPTPGAPKVCQYLGGCRPAGEICSESWQCCSNIDISEGGGAMCLEENATVGVGCEAHPIDGLSVCGLNTDPKEVGEICKDTEGNAVHTCCPSENCEETPTGVSRCSGGEGFGECRTDGDTCQVASQCCSGVCSPVETASGTELRCGAGCVEAQGLCTTNADCCGGLCVDGSCSEKTSTCAPLGDTCDAGGDCCSGVCTAGLCQTIIR